MEGREGGWERGREGGREGGRERGRQVSYIGELTREGGEICDLLVKLSYLSVIIILGLAKWFRRNSETSGLVIPLPESLFPPSLPPSLVPIIQVIYNYIHMHMYQKVQGYCELTQCLPFGERRRMRLREGREGWRGRERVRHSEVRGSEGRRYIGREGGIHSLVFCVAGVTGG